MRMEFRRTTGEDLAAVMRVFSQARRALRQAGVDQWQNGYPTPGVVEEDIEEGHSWVVTQDGAVAATCAVCFGQEPSYEHIHQGAWHCPGPYAALHRVAVAENARGSGLAQWMMERVLELCRRADVPCLRVDTHRNNLRMQRFLERNEFVYCGIIYLAEGAERLAFDRLL